MDLSPRFRLLLAGVIGSYSAILLLPFLVLRPRDSESEKGVALPDASASLRSLFAARLSFLPRVRSASSCKSSPSSRA